MLPIRSHGRTRTEARAAWGALSRSHWLVGLRTEAVIGTLLTIPRTLAPTMMHWRMGIGTGATLETLSWPHWLVGPRTEAAIWTLLTIPQALMPAMVHWRTRLRAGAFSQILARAGDRTKAVATLLRAARTKVLTEATPRRRAGRTHHALAKTVPLRQTLSPMLTSHAEARPKTKTAHSLLPVPLPHLRAKTGTTTPAAHPAALHQVRPWTKARSPGRHGRHKRRHIRSPLSSPVGPHLAKPALHPLATHGHPALKILADVFTAIALVHIRTPLMTARLWASPWAVMVPLAGGTALLHAVAETAAVARALVLGFWFGRRILFLQMLGRSPVAPLVTLFLVIA